MVDVTRVVFCWLYSIIHIWGIIFDIIALISGSYSRIWLYNCILILFLNKRRSNQENLALGSFEFSYIIGNMIWGDKYDIIHKPQNFIIFITHEPWLFIPVVRDTTWERCTVTDDQIRALINWYHDFNSPKWMKRLKPSQYNFKSDFLFVNIRSCVENWVVWIGTNFRQIHSFPSQRKDVVFIQFSCHNNFQCCYMLW